MQVVERELSWETLDDVVVVTIVDVVAMELRGEQVADVPAATTIA